jgi:GH15 family glucan-1,4-alpha-glucosidase
VGRYVWGGYYENGTLIWRSRWVLGDGGIVEVREALALPAEKSRMILLRRIEARWGSAQLDVGLDIRAGFGDSSFAIHQHGDGVWRGRSGDVWWRWSGIDRARQSDGGALMARVRLAPRQKMDLVLELSTAPVVSRPPDAAHMWQTTESRWRDSEPPMSNCAGRRDARHALAVLRGMTSADGGLIAAATTSLPERADSRRRYDYRYVWLRDLCYAGQAAAAAGADDLRDRLASFVTSCVLAHGSDLRAAYDRDGGPVPGACRLDGLPGYPGGSPVVRGNDAGAQYQLDVFGEILLLLSALAERDALDSDGSRAVEAAVASIMERWQEPDAGIWELDPQLWTHSRLICIAGLNRAARALSHASHMGTWMELADRMLAEIAGSGVTDAGRWRRSPADDRVDAALLLGSVRRAVPPDDPRARATLEAVLTELAQDGYCYRYGSDASALGEAEGAFNICGFWCSLALLDQGDIVGASRWFERARSACGPPGIFTEEFDVTQRELRGNLPQAFVHALCLETAARLGEFLGA